MEDTGDIRCSVEENINFYSAIDAGNESVFSDGEAKCVNNSATVELETTLNWSNVEVMPR